MPDLVINLHPPLGADWAVVAVSQRRGDDLPLILAAMALHEDLLFAADVLAQHLDVRADLGQLRLELFGRLSSLDADAFRPAAGAIAPPKQRYGLVSPHFSTERAANFDLLFFRFISAQNLNIW